MPSEATATAVASGDFLTDEVRLYYVETVYEDGMVLAEDAKDPTTTVLFTPEQVADLRKVVPAEA